MKAGLSDEIRKRLRSQPRDVKVYTEAIVVAAEDMRATAAEAAVATLTNCTALDDGSIQLTAASTGLISYASGSATNYSTLTMSGAFHVLAWAVDEAIPDKAQVRTIQCYLTRRRVAANAPFDGDWVLRVWRITDQEQLTGEATEHWRLGPLIAACTVPAASMTADTELVTFSFTGTRNGALNETDSNPLHPPLVLDTLWRPDYWTSGTNWLNVPDAPRVLVISVEARAASTVTSGSTNVAWIADVGAAAEVTTANVGWFMHRMATSTLYQFGQGTRGTPPGPSHTAGVRLHAYAATTGVGMLRATINVNSFATTLGAITYSLNLGAAPVGTVEFAAKAAVPPGTSCTFEARATTTDSYTVVEDGDTLADVALVTSQTYQMRASLVSNAAKTVTPTVYEMGVRDRTVTDWTDEATWTDEAESVDPRTGQGRMGQAEVALVRTGNRDYTGPERLLSEENFTEVELRRYIGHPDVARSSWLFCDLWRLDDYRLEEDRIVLTAVGVTQLLGGKYPSAGGSLSGYIVKSATAGNLSAGATGTDFTREMSQTVEAASSVTVSVAAGSTSISYAYTPQGVPNLTWFPSGTIPVKVTVSVADAAAEMRVRISRVRATATLVEPAGAVATLMWTEYQTLADVSTYVFYPMATWRAGVATDRLRVDYSTKATGANATVVLALGTAGSEVLPPWLPTTQTVPEVYSAESPASCWNDWVANVVAVPARYQGSGPATSVSADISVVNTGHLLSKNVFNADGRRELERIAFAGAGGCVIARQGRIEYAPLFKSNGPIVASFPMEETQVIDADLGFRERLPTYQVPFGYDGAKFRGMVTTQHSAALAAYGLSSIDAPDARLEDETAKWIHEPRRAYEMGREMVEALGAGFITLTFRPTVSYPELDIGDAVAVETDRYAVLDPETGASIRGPVWAYAVVIGKSGIWPDELTVWIRGLVNLFDVSASNDAREPFEPIIVQAIDVGTMAATAVSDPTRAEFQFRVFPADASVYYVYVTATETVPDRHNTQAWTAYTSGTTVQLLRASATKYLLFFGTRDNVFGPVLSVPVLARVALAAPTATFQESGSGASILVTANVGAAPTGARWCRAYGRITSTASPLYPTTTGLSTGSPDEQYLIAHRPVGGSGNWASFTLQSYANAGATVSETAAFAIGFWDENGNAGTALATAYTVTGSPTATLTNISWSVAVTGDTTTTRKWAFAWGVVTAVTDATHFLEIGADIDGEGYVALATVASPATATVTSGNVDSGYTVDPLRPEHTAVFYWKLYLDAGSVLVNSGGITDPFANDSWYGLA